MAGSCNGRPNLASVNPSLTCALCKGYLVNAMTLIRCMHSFCKSCIHRHLDTSSACPTCQQRVFRSRMDLHMVPDTTIQSIVYKTVPGLYANEMRRRRDFYESQEEPTEAFAEKLACGEDRGFPSRNIFTKDDSISLILEHRQDEVGSQKLDDRLSFKFVRYDPSLNGRTQCESPATLLQQKKQFSVPWNGVSTTSNGHSCINGTVDYAKYKVDTKSIDMARGALLKGRISNNGGSTNGTNKNKTYSRAGSTAATAATVTHMGHLSQLKSLPLTAVLSSCNGENTGDSTEEEEADNDWDSNVSTTIDRTLTTQQQQHQQQQQQQQAANSHLNHLNHSASSLQPINGNVNSCGQAYSLNRSHQTVSSMASPVAVSSSKHSKLQTLPMFLGQSQMLNPEDDTGARYHEEKNSPIVTRPQGLKVTDQLGQAQPVMQQILVSSLDNKMAKPVDNSKAPYPAGNKQSTTVPMVQHSSTSVAHQKYSQANAKASHKPVSAAAIQNKQIGPSHTTAKSLANPLATSPTNASASIVEGKSPTVLKIKLNIRPSAGETLSVASPPSVRDQRQSSAEKTTAASNSNGVAAAVPTVSFPTTSKEYRSVTSIKIKPLVAPSGPVTRKTPSPPVVNARDSRAAALDARKKRKLEEEARKLDEQKAKKGKKKSSAQPVINGTPFVPVQHKDLLTTHSFGWGSAAILWESQLRIPSPLIVPFTVSFARHQRKCLKQTDRKERSLSLSAKRFKFAQDVNKQDVFLERNFGLRRQTRVVKEPQNRIWRRRRHVSPPPVQVKLAPPDFAMSPVLESVLKAIALEDASDINSAESRTTPPVALRFDTSESALQKSELFLETTRSENGTNSDVGAGVFRMEFPGDLGANGNTSRGTPVETAIVASPAPLERRVSSSSNSEVKFSINSILSSDLGVGHKKATIEAKPETERQPNIHGMIESYLANLSKFFCILESCKPNVRASLQAACSEKKVVLIKILAILRNVSLAMAPTQSDKVLELAVLIQRHLLASDLVRSAGVQKIQSDTASQNVSECNTTKKACRIYDVNRNQLPLDGVSSCAEQKMTPPRLVSESPGTSISAEPTVQTSTHLCSPTIVRQVSGHGTQRKPFQMQELLVKELASALKRSMPSSEQEQKSAFELITIKRSSSVSSLNTSDGSENFGDGEVEPNRWEDVEVIPPPRPWPGCPSEV
ncbi:uncharacterized protein LOC111261803 isoform X2 [Varroa jacobsoni]|uniref:uncharacterized protein LOC111261803 isoform X2 n=1 Tax=Varroa jacobsoni TaxID=62625 RepID=UPI000BF37972|nr:uncharacterized protein LOC111261803 isoform X2 [Varroa jacobsoni]